MSSRQVLVGSIVPSAEGYIWPGHPDAQHVDVFPPEMSLSQQDIDLRLNPEERWRLSYPFTEPDVRSLQVNTSVNLANMAKSDSIVEMIQVHAYLEDVPDIGRRDFRRYPPYYGDSNYMFRPKVNGDNREREQNNRMKERSNLTEQERIDCSNAGNSYLTPLNNLCKGLYEQDIYQYHPQREGLCLKMKKLLEQELKGPKL